MMTLPRTMLALGLALGLAGCAAPSTQRTAPQTAAPSATLIEGRIGILPAQDMAANSCGLFLWSRTAERAMIFYASDRPAFARMVLDGQEVDLPRSGAEGERIFGHFTTQAFEAEGMMVRVTVLPEADDGVIGGAVVRRGSLNITAPDGWNLVLPVAGILACQGS